MRRLLLIDDDEGLGPPLATWFRRHGVELQQITRPLAALERLQSGPNGAADFDALILDVMLPQIDGFEVCRRLRREPSTAALPVLMLTARGDVMDRIVGLELGADDYLPKPFEPRELMARLQTILRRAQAAPAQALPRLQFDDLIIDLERRNVERSGQTIDLTGAEFELLVLLARAPLKVFSRDDILERLRGHAAEDIASRAVDILVSRLRRKLGAPALIHTRRNAGYLFAGARS
jgi:OmpR family response regulator RpaB